MMYSVSFAVGLLAYLRQAALSLHRAPSAFSEAMRSYYESHGLPHPSRVVACIDVSAQRHASSVAEFFARFSQDSVVLSAAETAEVTAALRTLETVLEKQMTDLDSERIRIRLSLSRAEDLVRRKLGRRAGEVEKVEHLNSSPGLALKPFGELAGAHWPDST